MFSYRPENSLFFGVGVIRETDMTQSPVHPAPGLSYLLTYLLTFLLTYSLTQCSTVLLEKLTGLQLVNKFSAFYGTRMFITSVTNARHLSPS
jgi:hypothetical protein